MPDNRGVAYMGPRKVEVQNIDYPTFELQDGPGVNPANVGRKLPHAAILRCVATRGEGIHHIAIEVDDIERALALATASGMRAIDQVPRPGAHGTRVAFLHPGQAHGVLLELVERPRHPPREEPST